MDVTLDVSDLCFGYGPGSVVLNQVSFELTSGQVLCLLGPNGAGKSTLLRCLLGLLSPTSGDVLLDGVALPTLTRRAIARRIAYVPQSAVMALPYTAFEVVLMGRTPHVDGGGVTSAADDAAAVAAFAALDIQHLETRPFDQMSGGERQLIMFARALCQGASLLVLDEPTASLDYGNQIKILKAIGQLRRRGYAIIITAHNPDHALHSATHVGMLRGGRLTTLEPPDTAITSARLSALYDTPIEVIEASSPTSSRPLRACAPLVDQVADAPREREV